MTLLSRPLPWVLLCLAAAGVIALLAASPARAHDHVSVGEYELIVGWREEPALAGAVNGLDLGIEDHLPNGTTVWVEGAAGALTATLSFGSSSVTKTLAPQFGRPGWYTFDVIPTREGVYSVRLRGTLNATTVDTTVALDPVAAASSIEFPVIDPTASELALQNAGLRIQVTVAAGVGVAGFAMAAIALAVIVRTRRGGREGT